MKKYIIAASLFALSIPAFAADNAVTGKVVKIVATPKGLGVKLDAGAPANCGTGYSSHLVINDHNHTMVALVLEAYKQDLDVTIKTIKRDEVAQFCTAKKIILK